MNKIIVVGYPKSGNTWISRLTAALVDCPVAGFLYKDYKEIAVEGGERKSEYRLFKSHHQLKELSLEDRETSKIIYVIRDPRDVSLSGRNYFTAKAQLFSLDLKSQNNTIHTVRNKFLKLINKIYRRLIYTFCHKSFMRREMNKAILNGNKNINYWCRVSWEEHATPFLNDPNVLKIQYECALEDTISTSKKILNFIGIEKDEHSILNDVKNQSFKERKKEFLDKKQTKKANFMRSGKKEQWKREFSNAENNQFVDSLNHILQNLGYSLKK